VCPRCAIPVPGGGVCGSCIRHPWLITQTYAALRYEGDARRLVHGYKFAKDLVAGRVLAQALSRKVSAYASTDVLVPVPSTRERLKQRGFDPAHEIARFLCSVSAGTTLLPSLSRRDGSVPQSRVRTRVGRRSNVENVFHVKHPSAPVVTLVDDVLTTGATANAAASALLDAGASSVNLWVCVRTP
jgi:ComF family protein